MLRDSVVKNLHTTRPFFTYRSRLFVSEAKLSVVARILTLQRAPSRKGFVGLRGIHQAIGFAQMLFA